MHNTKQPGHPGIAAPGEAFSVQLFRLFRLFRLRADNVAGAQGGTSTG